MENIDVKTSKLEDIEQVSYDRSVIIFKNTQDNHCAIWCILARLQPAETNFSLTGGHKQNFIPLFKNSGDASVHNGFQIIPQIRNNNLSVCPGTKWKKIDPLKFYQYANTSENAPEERMIYMLLYGNLYCTLEKLKFLRNKR